jgi:hypothetical protein
MNQHIIENYLMDGLVENQKDVYHIFGYQIGQRLKIQVLEHYKYTMNEKFNTVIFFFIL